MLYSLSSIVIVMLAIGDLVRPSSLKQSTTATALYTYKYIQL